MLWLLTSLSTQEPFSQRLSASKGHALPLHSRALALLGIPLQPSPTWAPAIKKNPTNLLHCGDMLWSTEDPPPTLSIYLGRLCSRVPQRSSAAAPVYLSEKGTVERDRVKAVHCPHGDIQVHKESLLLLSVHSGSDSLQGERGKRATEGSSRRVKGNSARQTSH